MFIVIYFGYQQYRLFTIDVLTSTLSDCIWNSCISDLVKYITTRTEILTKEQNTISRNLIQSEKKLFEVEKQIAELEEKNNESSKDLSSRRKLPKAKAPPPKKGGKVEPGNPLEEEKIKLISEIEVLKEQASKYNEKSEKLKEFKMKFLFEENKLPARSYIDLVDIGGERKFMNSKLTSRGLEFLTPKISYYLSLCKQNENPEEEDEIALINIPGHCVRTLEEDKSAVEEVLPEMNKNKKDTKKGGKKK